MRTRTTREWEERLLAAEVPHAPVWDYAQLFAQPHAEARGLRVTVRDPEGRPVDLTGPPFHIAGARLPPPTLPPALGQHTDAVLKDLLGFSDARLEELRRQGVIG
jgi:crotonobetainyl-CoA:carnitine CoA-transferase CaiB-like acyl-CoA transferase